LIFQDLLTSVVAAPAAAGGLLDPLGLLKTLGVLGLVAIIFAETGLLIGFFLPGDSLLFAAGLLIAIGIPVGDTRFQLLLIPEWGPFANYLVISTLCFIAAVLGDSVGYYFGHRVGTRLFQKEDSFFFHKKNLLRAQAFYEKHGGKTIIIARFVPIVRTFAPVIAGIGTMNYRRFLAFNVIGGFVWCYGVTLLGFLLGNVIPPEDVDKYLLPLIALIILISIAPIIWHVLKEKESRDALMNGARGMFKRNKTKNIPTEAELTTRQPVEAEKK
jgi:membrane-associated protein